MNESAVTAALERAARRGVNVTAVMTADREWDTAFAALMRAGNVVDGPSTTKERGRWAIDHI